jgi:hypothetical protein
MNRKIRRNDNMDKKMGRKNAPKDQKKTCFSPGLVK